MYKLKLRKFGEEKVRQQIEQCELKTGNQRFNNTTQFEISPPQNKYNIQKSLLPKTWTKRADWKATSFHFITFHAANIYPHVHILF